MYTFFLDESEVVQALAQYLVDTDRLDVESELSGHLSYEVIDGSFKVTVSSSSSVN